MSLPLPPIAALHVLSFLQLFNQICLIHAVALLCSALTLFRSPSQGPEGEKKVERKRKNRTEHEKRKRREIRLALIIPPP